MCEKMIASAQSNGGQAQGQGAGQQRELGPQEGSGGRCAAVEECHTTKKSPTDSSQQQQGQHQQQQSPQPNQPHPQPTSPSQCPTPNPTRLCFGEYDIESYQEWQSISEVLVLNQFKELGGLLARYKGIAVSLGWQTQLAFIVELERRLGTMVRERRGRLVGLGE